jgi:hypothetical protein
MGVEDQVVRQFAKYAIAFALSLGDTESLKKIWQPLIRLTARSAKDQGRRWN